MTIGVVKKAEGGTTKCLNKRFSTDSRPLLHISPHQVPFKPHNELIQVIANEPIFAGLAIGIISSCPLLSSTLRDSMYRALSYSARLDQPAAGKVLETANGGCLVDQKSGTENYKWSVRGKGMETWPKAFSKYHF